MIRSALFATAMLTASACAAAPDESQVTDAPAALPFETLG
jgi:hypothetical protein